MPCLSFHVDASAVFMLARNLRFLGAGQHLLTSQYLSAPHRRGGHPGRAVVDLLPALYDRGSFLLVRSSSWSCRSLISQGLFVFTRAAAPRPDAADLARIVPAQHARARVALRSWFSSIISRHAGSAQSPEAGKVGDIVLRHILRPDLRVCACSDVPRRALLSPLIVFSHCCFALASVLIFYSDAKN
jgi:hypothetical protein